MENRRRTSMKDLLTNVVIQVNARAKRVLLKASARGNLVVVIPRWFRRSLIPQILEDNREWLEATQRRLRRQMKELEAESMGRPAKIIHLRAIQETWSVRYQTPLDGRYFVQELHKGSLLVHASERKHDLCETLLRNWLREKARIHLLPWLDEVSEQVGLPFASASIRNQRTRWASCSRRKTISLNQKLLFFPPELVRYIFIHELCHTIHLNHSRRFWKLVEMLEPEYRLSEIDLRNGWRYVPVWSDREA
ncbi:MAG: DUF45 domain-containing protein [bacterium]|nr:DUF45 domain-containing protein [bacterium]